MSSVLTPEETAALRENMQSSPTPPEPGQGAAPSAAAAAPGSPAEISVQGSVSPEGAAPANFAAGGERRGQAPAATQGSGIFVESGERGIRKKLPGLQRRFNVMAERLRLIFSKTLRTPVSIDSGPMTTLAAPAIGETVPTWAVASEMRWTNLGNAGYIGLNHQLSFALIELAYGAPPSQLLSFELTSPRQRLTEVERQTLAPLLQGLAKALAEAMPQHVVGTVSSQPMAFPVQVDPEKAVEGGILKIFEFKVGKARAQVMVLLFSHVLEHLDDAHPSNFEQTAQMLSAHLGQTHVDVMAMLGQTNVSLQTVLALKAGDMVWLDCAQTDYLPVFVEQSLKFLAQPIARNGALGVEIVARVP
jgi:flagellar motor switch protein FliM